MRWLLTIWLAIGVFQLVAAQDTVPPGTSAMVLGGPANVDLAAGAMLIQSGDYEEGIERTLLGLQDQTLTARLRSAGLSNLCAAYAAKAMADAAIQACTESLVSNDANWRAYSNRSYAYWIMGRFTAAQSDLDRAAALSPHARQIAQIRGMINERRLRPNIVMEDLQ